MWVFLAVYVGVYGGMNAYACLKFCRAFGIRGSAAGVCSGVAVLMVLLPLALRSSERRLPEPVARVAGYVLFTWMAWVFWFICVHFCVDAWNLIAGGARAGSGLYPGTRWLRAWGGLQIPARPAAYAALAWVLCASVWGWFEAGRVRVRTIEMRTPLLPSGSASVRVVQISDMHAGYQCRDGVFRAIVRAVREAEPDILVGTGDLVDGHPASLGETAEALASLPAPLGKFAVVGNHEVYPGLARSLAFLERSGFRVLRGSFADTGGIRIRGVDDPAAGRSESGSGQSVTAAPGNGGRFTILLQHRPEPSPSPDRADLQLSGHIHGGQIFPFGLITRATYGHPVSRLVPLDGGGTLYISPGSGTWGPPFRLFAPPEVTLFVIGPAAGAPPSSVSP